jgi:hypothetical protein
LNSTFKLYFGPMGVVEFFNLSHQITWQWQWQVCKYNGGINYYCNSISTHGDASKFSNNSFLLALINNFFNSFYMQGTTPLHVICAPSSIKSKATKVVIFNWFENLVDLVGLFIYNHITCVLASMLHVGYLCHQGYNLQSTKAFD